MRRQLLAAAAIVGVVGIAGLTGCEYTGQRDATCVTDPPTPHTEFGTVGYDIEAPLEVHSGDTFTVRVDILWGTYGPATSPPDNALGTIGVTGAVTQPGSTRVGEPPVGSGYPATLTYTATGPPGGTIEIAALDGGWYAVYPSGLFYVECDPVEPHVATVRVTG